MSLIKKNIRIGLELGYIEDLQGGMNKCIESGYSFICVNVRDNKNLTKTEEQKELPTSPFFPWCCAEVNSLERKDGIVGTLSHFSFDLYNDDKSMARIAEKKLIEEINFYQYLGFPAILVELSEKGISQLARLVLSKAGGCDRVFTPYFWIKVDLGKVDENFNTKKNEMDSFNMWKMFITLCDNNKNIFPVLELPKEIPNANEIDRWLSVKITAIFISTDVFIKNRFGHPILPESHFSVLKRFLIAGTLQVVIHGQPGQGIGLKYYRRYLKYVYEHLVRADR